MPTLKPPIQGLCACEPKVQESQADKALSRLKAIHRELAEAIGTLDQRLAMVTVPASPTCCEKGPPGDSDPTAPFIQAIRDEIATCEQLYVRLRDIEQRLQI